MSEDCLYLQVVRPSGIDPATPLPVAVWIHGGGLFMGGVNDPRYNSSFIVQNSVEMGTPVIAVAIQYRLSAWGFLGGDEILAEGSTNLGFRDQRLALHWIQENIAAFGGSPEDVTIWGESAGAASVGAQLLAYNGMSLSLLYMDCMGSGFNICLGRDDKLFKGAIAQSGGPAVRFFVTAGFQSYNSTIYQSAYDLVVSRAGCEATSTTTSLECLRALPFEELNNAINTTASNPGPFPHMLDNDFISNTGSSQLSAGAFVPVPLLIGTNTDEGSSFAPRTPPCNTESDFLSILATSGISGTAATTISALYPNIPAIGIPSLSSIPYSANSTDSQTLGTAYRRLRAYFGDLSMHVTRRASNHAWSKKGVKSWAYRWDVTTFAAGAGNGAEHFQEVSFVFDNVEGLGYAINPFEGLDSGKLGLAKEMSRRWVSFIVKGEPTLEGGAEWPVYDLEAGAGVGRDMVFGGSEGVVEEDSYRAEAMEWVWEHAGEVYGI